MPGGVVAARVLSNGILAKNAMDKPNASRQKSGVKPSAVGAVSAASSAGSAGLGNGRAMARCAGLAQW